MIIWRLRSLSLSTRVPLQFFQPLLHCMLSLSALFLALAADRRHTRDRECSAVVVAVAAKPKDGAAAAGGAAACIARLVRMRRARARGRAQRASSSSMYVCLRVCRSITSAKSSRSFCCPIDLIAALAPVFPLRLIRRFRIVCTGERKQVCKFC